MNPSPLTDLQLKATNPSASLWVEASAGTGKTKVLVDRLLRLMLEGSSLESILCLTYTKAGALEMEERLSHKLFHWASCSEEALIQDLALFCKVDATLIQRARRLCTLWTQMPSGMHIYTIHGFCQRLLLSFPMEAGLQPGFQILDEQTSKALLDDCLEKILMENQNQTKMFLEQRSFFVLKELLLQIIQNRQHVTWTTNAQALGALASFLNIDPTVTPADILNSIQLPHSLRVIEHLSAASSSFQKMGQALRDFFKDRDIYTFDGYLSAFLKADGTIRQRLYPARFIKDHPDICSILEQAALDAADAHLQIIRLNIFRESALVIELLSQMLDTYSTLKAKMNGVDYDDLIQKTHLLLTEGDASLWVLYMLDHRLEHVLVDEAQDTSPSQFRILEKLVEDFYAGLGQHDRPRTLFVVGDPKQSIFSFQGADTGVFQNYRQVFQAKGKANGSVFEHIGLSLSFRSTPPLLAYVDQVFNRPFIRDAMGALDLSHASFKANAPGHLEIWPLIQRDVDEVDEPLWSMESLDQRLQTVHEKMANQIADKIKEWLEKGRLLTASKRIIEPKDIMILIRKRDALVPALLQALRSRNIPASGGERRLLKDFLVIQDMLALTQFVLRPNDDMTLALVLKGPFVGLTEEALFTLCRGRKGSLWQRLKVLRTDPTYQTAHTFLSQVLNKADHRTPFGFFSMLLAKYRGLEKCVARLGYEVQGPLEAFLDTAFSYGRQQAPSLQGFIMWFLDQDIPFEGHAEQAGEVRIMTVHGAKGLQSPIVILPDTTHVPDAKESFYWIQDSLLVTGPGASILPEVQDLQQQTFLKSLQESYRLLYVAMTRAEEELYIGGVSPAHGVSPYSWYATLEMAASERPDLFLNDPPQYANKKETETKKITWPSCLGTPLARPKVIKPKRPSAPARQMSLTDGLSFHALMHDLWRLGDHPSTHPLLEAANRLVDYIEHAYPGFEKYPEQAILSPHMEGRLDLMLIHPRQRRVVVVDYKTTGGELSPHPDDIIQIQTYMDMLQETFKDYSIEGLLLLINLQDLRLKGVHSPFPSINP